MKRTKTSIRRIVGDVALLGTLVVSKKCLDKIEEHMNDRNKREKALNRKLAITGLIYHAIGIFYNE